MMWKALWATSRKMQEDDENMKTAREDTRTGEQRLEIQCMANQCP